ncbi:AprI/Inh family metalloprotease inhibitor [Pelagibacterium luteolum]|uniref:Protease inhibitor Inh n=1 Tax=Pelagibacterium luteolum TaxID=440168 RepID=A0A1G7SCY7_9HYPH|nr:AprI/Inh family metalloprotease inhibitor [Pelagibacterium luteolum]SDG20060.1 Protease inhibitor Inh [Pelagibacterium luteolum]
MFGNLVTPLRSSVAVFAVFALAACSPTGFGNQQPAVPPAMSQPAPITPVQSTAVQTTDLPPIAGTTSTPQTTPSTAAIPGNTASVSGNTQTVASTSGFGMGNTTVPGNTTGGRDLSGNVTMEQLLGGWTILVGADQCRLNLTYTAKGSSGRYRASTPACAEPTLASVTSWQLLGNQIQLYNEADTLVGTLLKSGNRFVGTLSGGQAISLVG